MWNMLFVFKNRRDLSLLKSQWKWAKRERLDSKEWRIWALGSSLWGIKKGVQKLVKLEGRRGPGGGIQQQEFGWAALFRRGQFPQIKSGPSVYVLNVTSHFSLPHLITPLPMLFWSYYSYFSFYNSLDFHQLNESSLEESFLQKRHHIRSHM